MCLQVLRIVVDPIGRATMIASRAQVERERAGEAGPRYNRAAPFPR
jgi:hypothetical protein